MAVPEVQDTFFCVSEPVRRAEPLPHAEDAKQTSDAGVNRALGRTARHSPASGGRCARVCSDPVWTCRWRGQEEETEEEKVVLLRSRVRDSGRGGLWSSIDAYRSGLSAYTRSCCRIVVQFQKLPMLPTLPPSESWFCAAICPFSHNAAILETQTSWQRVPRYAYI